MHILWINVTDASSRTRWQLFFHISPRFFSLPIRTQAVVYKAWSYRISTVRPAIVPYVVRAYQGSPLSTSIFLIAKVSSHALIDRFARPRPSFSYSMRPWEETLWVVNEMLSSGPAGSMALDRLLSGRYSISLYLVLQTHSKKGRILHQRYRAPSFELLHNRLILRRLCNLNVPLTRNNASACPHRLMRQMSLIYTSG